MRALFAAVLVLGCARPQAVADPVADAPTKPTPSGTVLPLVSGCGCAYQCARGLRVAPDGVWEVTHDFLDSATIKAVIETRCFDSKGVARAGDCQRVFYDRSSCGGECIPTTAYLRCDAK